MSPSRYALVLALSLSSLVAPALAQQAEQNRAAPPASMPPMSRMSSGQNGARSTSSPADHAMMAGMEKMNRTMSDAPMTGNPDRDFVTMMIPHHQGAIDMARVELQYGKDPTLRRMAKDVVSTQEKEISEMRRWQEKHRNQ